MAPSHRSCCRRLAVWAVLAVWTLFGAGIARAQELPLPAGSPPVPEVPDVGPPSPHAPPLPPIAPVPRAPPLTATALNGPTAFLSIKLGEF